MRATCRPVAGAAWKCPSQVILGEWANWLNVSGDNQPRSGFWSTETLKARLPALIDGFVLGNVETASYTLTIGEEVFISPIEASSGALSQTVKRLAIDECFTIPPGQFANLITSETVAVPNDALALISIKFQIKGRGLVNVSGFHVDPGYKGRLVFTVFNAGPAPIHLRRGQPTFLIWYASLDQPTSDVRDLAIKPPLTQIDQTRIISGEVPSYAGLRERIRAVEESQKVHTAIAAFLVSVAFLMLGAIFKFPPAIFGTSTPIASPSFVPTTPSVSSSPKATVPAPARKP